MLKKLITLFLIIIVGIGCAAKKTSVSYSPKKIPKGQSSYYYYLISDLKDRPETTNESEAFLDQALKKDQDSSYLWAQKAIKEAQKSNWDKAIQLAEKSLAKNPNNVEAIVLLGKLYAAKGEPKTAISYYRQSLTMDRKNEEVYNIMAREYSTLQEPNNAIQTLKNCINEIPESMSCMYYIGTLQLQNKNFNEALKYFNQIKEFNPEDIKVLQTIAEIYVEQKKYDQAIDLFEQIRSLDPTDVAISIRIALLYYEMEDLDKAIQEFVHIHQRYPKSDRVNYFLGLLYLEQKDLDKSYAHFDQINKKSTFYNEAVNRMIFILKQKDELSGAVDLLEKKVNNKDDLPDYYMLKVSLLITNRDYKKALSVVGQGLEKFHDEKNLLFQKAIILEKLDQWEESKTILKHIIVIDPSIAKIYNFIGYTMLLRNDSIDEALGYLKKANELLPKDGHITDSLGWAYFKRGDVQTALMYLNRANSQRPDEPTILAHLGDVYFHLKNKRKAREYYEKSLQILSGMEKKAEDEEELENRVRERLGEF